MALGLVARSFINWRLSKGRQADCSRFRAGVLATRKRKVETQAPRVSLEYDHRFVGTLDGALRVVGETVGT